VLDDKECAEFRHLMFTCLKITICAIQKLYKPVLFYIILILLLYLLMF